MLIEKMPDPEQVTAVKNFLMFMSERVNHTASDFMQMQDCSPDDMGVLFVLAQQSPLTVKEIAQRLHQVSLSKLTRVLDHLEEGAYITRSLNRTDRRSFYIAPTPKGNEVVEALSRHMEIHVQGMLKTLTPAERLMFLELLAKIEANWDSANSIGL